MRGYLRAFRLTFIIMLLGCAFFVLLSTDAMASNAASESFADVNSAEALSPPEFEISSLSFEYDGVEHKLEFSRIYHPMLDSGFLTYDWYKDGVSLGLHSASIGVRNVSDSGKYTCTITFSVMGESVSVTTPDISVSISRATVNVPSIPSATYTGDEIYPSIFDTGTYFVARRAYSDAGIYPISITLRDPENYAFFGSDATVVYADFEILRAYNSWLASPTVVDVYESSVPTPRALSRFGEPRFEFSHDGVLFTTLAPSTAGEYFMRAVVDEAENYTKLVSDPVPFRIIAEEVAGIAIATPAERLTYRAFDLFDPTGLTIAVTYNSGRREIIGTDVLTFSYPRGDSFRFLDRGIVVSYGTASVLLSVEVTKADYDVSGISFSDLILQYDGRHKSAVFEGELPIGDDGIPLCAEVSGGGVNAGVYTVYLEFFTDSDNYNLPSPLQATLTVEPRSTLVAWSDLSFVYDGCEKLPTAYYLDVNGTMHILTPIGAGTSAGIYAATVTSPDANYIFNNNRVSFEILKADYDMSSATWCGGGTYNGNVHEVYLTSLPDGVRVVGYVDNKATDVGTYVARASLAYDTVNFNSPTVPEFVWKILPAEYPDCEYRFDDTIAIFDGLPHYPTLVGEMPTGADGISLRYTFSSGATHVSEGRVAVEITFASDSTNYIPPQSTVAYVEISPMPITVSWHALDFVYSGRVMTPYAVAYECSVTVTGGAINAGTYTATATADNIDYTILNNTCEFTIQRAENGWITPISVSDVFLGGVAAPAAVALAGETFYEYFLDRDCIESLSESPTEIGTYYVRAVSYGDKNHNAITSEPVSFSIIAVIPVSFNVTLASEDYLAFDVISLADVAAVILNNDGSELPIDSALLEILYPSAESLRYGDTSVEIRYGEFVSVISVNVEKRSYDLSSVAWNGTDYTYDGDPKYASLSGLPNGVSVTEYTGNGNVAAGTYTVTAHLSYDEQNYITPTVPDATMTIRKLVVPLPNIDRAFYCGAANIPTIPESPYYTFTFSIAPISAGRYPISLTVTDTENCEFPDGLSEATVDFLVSPRSLTVTVDSVTLYLFESVPPYTWNITSGELVRTDVLTPTFYERDGKIYAEFDNPNYTVTVTPGDLVKKRTLSPDATGILLIVVFALITTSLAVFAVVKNRRRLYYAYRAHLCRANTDLSHSSPAENAVAVPSAKPIENDVMESQDSIASDAVDVEYADTAITNSLAKDLIRRDERVETAGRRKSIINVDTLSDNFAAGDRVDINILKSRSLIPYDTAYIKVLARGVIDKPLFVYANDFSLAAVKMIALKGGRAIKVATSAKIKFSKGIEKPRGK